MKSLFQSLMRQLPEPLRNRYFLALTLFFGWMIFFDRHDVLTQWRLQRSLSRLEADRAYFAEKIEEAQKEQADLERNREKFARERYYMKKSNEDVFVIVPEN